MEEGRAREENDEDDTRREGRDIPVQIIVVHVSSLVKGVKENVSGTPEISFREDPRGYIYDCYFHIKLVYRLDVDPSLQPP
jgi:hypothetical protein